MTSGVRHRARPRTLRHRSAPARWWGWAAGITGAVLTVGAWTLAAPPVSAPDDQYHTSSIWCSHGDRDGLCDYVAGDDHLRMVPAYVTVEATCFAGKPDVSAACQDELLADSQADTGTVVGNWWGHAYPPVFYWLLGLFASTHFELSVIAMRLFASLCVVGLAAWLAALVPSSMRPAAVVPLVVTTVPVGLFMIASTNPSSWAIGSAAVVWVALHAAFRARGAARAQLVVITILGSLMGAGARADACLFTVMAVGLAVLLNLARLRKNPVATAAAVACLALATALFLYAGQSTAMTAGLGTNEINQPTLQMGWLELAGRNLLDLPILWLGVLAFGALGSTGSLDNGFPTLVGTLLVGALTIVLYASWRRPRGAMLVGQLLTAAALVLYPLYVLGRSSLPVGAGMQPRYLLPLLVMLVGLVMLNGGARLTRRTAWGIAAALTVANGVAMHIQMRRYISGRTTSGLSLGSDRDWWWEHAPPPDLVWLLGCLGFALLAAVAVGLCVATAEPAWEDVTPHPDDGLGRPDVRHR